MKMISSTSMTSMNGVTLISCASANSSSSSKPPSAIDAPIALLRRARMRATGRTDMGAVEVARQQPRGGAGSAAHQLEIGFGHPRKVVVDDHRRNRRDQADRGGEQRLGNAG